MRGPDEGDQAVVLEADLLAGVEVEVADLQRDPRAGLALGVVERVVGGDQAAVDRVAEVGQVEAAEGAVPVRAVALAAVELAAGDFEVVGVGVGPARPAASRCETPEHPGVHLVALGIPRLEVPPEPPARKNGLSSLGGRTGRPEPLALARTAGAGAGRQHPLGHLAVGAVGQVDLAQGQRRVDRRGRASSARASRGCPGSCRRTA